MFYKIETSINNKIIGQYPQIQDAELPAGWENNLRFTQNILFKKVDFEPIAPKGILHKKAKLTDLLSTVPPGFTPKLLVSNSFKIILEEFEEELFQYFPCDVLSKNVPYKYWLASPLMTKLDNVDFKLSDVEVRKSKPEGGTYLERVQVSTLNEFNDYLQAQGILSWKTTISRVEVKNNVKDNIFVLTNVDGGVGYYVSETFKNAVEYHGLTGIEFMPSNMTFVEWLHGGSREKIYGKA
ncbi:hypothetical protein DU508_09610 [Pedobacter chinensis]|uniref:Immunity MXAN-0049 protein domain-containing protein n=1 Tax=Pedobacter chinensis TaxID=2282421 RepID=A0A369PYS8_9SPHI|nr:DUF1629 domain-containing protein [Pedobacter chinensis]RDC57402.1 hypothetical protein DU508_09610 [Pedobacter chinensis]